MTLITSRRILKLLIVTFFMVIAASQTNTTLAQGSNCTTSSPAGTYSITVCITAPENGSTISGQRNVTATVGWSGSPHPAVGKLTFSLGPDYLLTAFKSPYTFSLLSSHFIDATYNLSVIASLSDGQDAAPAAISLTFANGVTSPPTNPNTFIPYVPSAPAQPFIVAATGDGASGVTASVTDRIASWNPGMFLYLGDVYEKGTFTEFRNWYGTPTTFFGQFRSITNPVIGNHEYENGAAPGYFDYWDNIPNYYSYDAAGWHFIALNSNSALISLAPGSPQYQWLVQDLANSTALCTIAYFHHPVYSVGPQGDTPQMNAAWQLMAQSGVDVVVTGHDHDYQRWLALDLNGNPNSQGITQFVVGTGGHGIQGFVRSDPRMPLGFDTTPNALGALKMSLGTSSMMYQYINAAGTSLDMGIIPCHDKPVDTTPPTTPTGLTATLNSQAYVNLQWGASTDDVGINGYTIYRDGAALATVVAPNLTYTDTTVQGNTTYNYTVDTYDLSGNHSPQSNTATITIPNINAQTIIVTADSYVNGDSPGTNYGSATTLRTDASPVQRSYLRFDVPALSSNIVSATLRVYATGTNNTGYTLWDTSGGWNETTINFSNAPGLGNTLGNSGQIAANTWTQVDVTSFVTGTGSYNFAMSTTSSTATIFTSRNGTAANRPQLVLRVNGSIPTNTPTYTATATNTATLTPTRTPTSTSTPT